MSWIATGLPGGRARRLLGLSAAALLAAAGARCVDTSSFEADGAVDLYLGDIDLGKLRSIAIVPADATLVVTSTQPTSLTFRAVGTYDDGKQGDVTAEVSFQVTSTAVGAFAENVFYPSLSWGGQTTVLARTSNGLSATTSLTVVFTRRFFEGGAPDTADKRFEQAATQDGPTPTLAYPPDNVLVPPNLVDLEFQWLPGTGQTLFEVSLSNVGTDIRIYTPCAKVGAGCGYIPGAAVWKAVVGALGGGDAAQVVIRGLDEGTSRVGKSSARALKIAEEEIQGGLYYWAATPGAVVRYDFGKSNQTAGTCYPRAAATALACVGCHAMSLDGSRMAVGLDMPMPARLRVIDVKTKAQLSKGAGNFMAFSPDGQLLITSDGKSMVLRDPTTNQALSPNPLMKKGTMPDWSADGAMVVYADPAVVIPFFGQPGIERGSLKLLHYRAATKQWSAPVSLVISKGENNYYPSFSPDAQWVVFNRSSGESYDAPDASLWLVRSDGKGSPVQLEEANQDMYEANSWPKFSPFLQKYRGATLMWVTFSSRRDYGLRLKGQDRAQLWMAAISPNKSEHSQDPSYPAFWLPFQSLKTGNHIAQWTKTVVKKPCGPDDMCPTGFVCRKGMCEPE